MADGNCIEKWLQLTKRNKTIANRGSPPMSIKYHSYRPQGYFCKGGLE